MEERIAVCEKNAIKNGMCFKYKDRCYVKIGTKCIEMDVRSSILFKEIEPEEIELIFNRNGTLKMWCKKVNEIDDEEEEEIEKIKLELTQRAYLASNGNREWYEAHAIDLEGNNYIVYWEIRDDFNPLYDEDESYACNWNSPVKIKDEFGNEQNLNEYELTF